MNQDFAIQLLIGAVVTLWGSLVALLLYIRHIHNKHNNSQQSNLKVVIEEQVKSRQALENNNKLYDKVFDHITKSTQK